MAISAVAATFDLGMGSRKITAVVLTFVALTLPAAALALHHHATATPERRHMPVAVRSSGVPEIGALYAVSHATWHGCTASVVRSPRGDMVITAAHCVVRSGVGMVFVPGEHGTEAPYGRWIVTAAYLERSWLRRQDIRADVAFLVLAPRMLDGVSTEIEQVTGAYQLGSTAVRGQRITVTGYPAGRTDDPITCATRTYRTGTFDSFDCRGFVDGTSGSPWLRATNHGPQIVGVIGGLHQGGCEDYTSYSSPLSHGAHVAYRRASRGGAGDVGPRAGGDGC
jgi:V8-like Glu-specific endopeptidase